MAESDQDKWNHRYSGQEVELLNHPSWIIELDDQIPRCGFALDIAAGSGRLAIWLAQRGLRVTAVDISSIGMQLVHKAADTEKLHIQTVVSDLEVDPLPDGGFQVVTCFRYWQAELFPAIYNRLASGGVFLSEVAVKQNLERHNHPSARYLAEPGQLKRLCSPMEIIYYQEGWFDDQASARILARKV